MNALVIFIRRPVLASMVTALLLVLGLFSYRVLGVDLMPKIEIPVGHHHHGSARGIARGD